MAKTLADFVREAQTRVRAISVEEFDEMIENHDDLLIVDVREPEEFHRGHIPGALLVPRGTLAADVLQQMGFEKVYVLAGGIAQWQAEGFVLSATEAAGRVFCGWRFSLHFSRFARMPGFVAWNVQKFHPSRKQYPTARNPSLAQPQHAVTAARRATRDWCRRTGVGRSCGAAAHSVRRGAPAP
ncbi:MAG: rhodanese-like domain-containing protein [Gammaproteobacteria bacterium]|nr:rhodanese-like domain-containing protein [Gammaproteobacteria bacterium]